MAKFHFDPDLCIKCHACEVACAIWHDIPAGEPGYRVVVETNEGEFPGQTRDFKAKITKGCDVCKNAGGYPHCVATCPTQALTYD